MHTTVTEPEKTAQQRFNNLYITAAEIAELVGVTQVAVYKAQDSGKLPGAVRVAQRGQYVWERVAIQPHIDAWRTAMEAKRPHIPEDFPHSA